MRILRRIEVSYTSPQSKDVLWVKPTDNGVEINSLINGEWKSVESISKELIPEEASSENKLADRNFVTTLLAESDAVFKGNKNLITDLGLTLDATDADIAAKLNTEIIDANSNDYCYVAVPTSAETPTQIAKVKRFKHDGESWGYEFDVNNSGFTAAQWDAINSGVSVAKVLGYDTHVSDGNIHVTTANKSVWNAKYDKPSGGIPKTDLADAVQTSLGKADTALQEHQDISGKANTSEMSVTTGTGANADKTTIQLKTGTSATVLNAHQQLKTINNESITGSGNITIVTDISGKADKVDVGDKANLTTTDKSTLVAAINEVNTKALTIGEVEVFSTSKNYPVGEFVTYDNKLYKFTSAHPAGAWNSNDVEETTIVEQLEEFTASADGLTNKVENFEGALVGNTPIEEFSESTTYGTDVSQVHYCYRNNLLYAAIATHTGAWNAAHFEQVSILETTIPVYETVNIELKTFAEGTPIDDVNVTVQVEGEADARTLPTNAAGKCSTTILRGLTYTITFPHIDNYIDLENVSRQAAIAQRTIIGKYRSILNPNTETVTVQVNYSTAGNKATSFNVVYDETDHTVNIDANTDTATFTVPEGFRYTIEMPYVEGYRTPADVSFVAEGGGSRSIRRLYHPYIEDGIFWKMKDGSIRELADITREDYDNDRIFGLAFTMSTLQGGNEFIIPFRYLLSGFGSGQWQGDTANVPELAPPIKDYITTEIAGLADLDGEGTCRIIREFCNTTGRTSDVAKSTYNLVFQVDGIDRHCFTPAYGQLKQFAINRNTINNIFNGITGINIINPNSGTWWTSSQGNDGTNGVQMDGGNFSSNYGPKTTKTLSWNILPACAYL